MQEIATFMPDFDRGFKTVAHVSARQLAQVAGTVCSCLRPIVSEIQHTGRPAIAELLSALHGEILLHFSISFPGKKGIVVLR
jgi:hypothetical protein